jgi:hypothetical protein
MDPTRSRIHARAASIAAISLLALALAAVPARAQNAEADQKFEEAERLLAAGKVVEACAAFEESNRLEPGAGALISIGLCKEKLGQLASALAAYEGALARVRDPKKKAIARERVAALESRVSRVKIVVPSRFQMAGLAVTRNGAPVDAADWGRAVPVDGGRYEIAVSAPGYHPWRATIEVADDGGKATVEVPMLAVVVEMVKDPEARAGGGGEPTPATGGQRSLRPALKVAGYGLVGVGVASAVYVLYLTLAGPERDYEQLDDFPKDTTNMNMPVPAGIRDCNRSELRAGSDPTNQAFDRACAANARRHVLSVIALAAGVTGGVALYFAYRGGGGASGKQAAAGARGRRELAVTPHIGPHGGGASLRFTW